ncbi:eukaryotic translation initiation factor 2D [Aphis gossypii]|uniref:Eukaryotic translation initiation factor 2D n=1 Tax=Aphis gossypii TaxID=80765 RepID=A0A9P0J7S5_APHGO|nr:eukaryotic translation initiation factor 2D [Aphis gossypii]XP_050061686.1 eukaryotic translation initiation factor 2D [Aphis gossypii]CAH1731913.1 unnamed protein product [Aphis gossypii]
MFKKEFRIKSSTPLKGADQKKLKSTIGKHFNLTNDTLDEFLSHKQLSLLKIITYTNDIIKIYCAQEVALVFDHKGKYYPTLFMVWSFPHIVPRLILHEDLKSKINDPSQLAIKDISSVNNDDLLVQLPVDQCVSICTNSCEKIIAIGYLIIDGNTIKNHENKKDICLKVLHFHKDELFKSNIINIIPEIISTMERSFKKAPELNDLPNQIEDNRTVIEKMDELLMTCSLKALKYCIKKEMLPILASTFYKKYVMKFCPEGIELDIKKTSFKKLSTFLQLLDVECIIKFNVGSNGIAEITQVMHSNSKFQEINIEENSEFKENNDQYTTPVKEIYIVTPGLQPIFSEFLCRKGDELPLSSIRRYVTEYVKKYELQDKTDPSIVNTNDVLKKILSQRKDKSSITFKDLIEEVTKLMHRTEISVLNTDTKKNLKKKVNNIEMTVNNRSGNKKVTLVNNLELYGVDVLKFSKECQHGVAASTTINDIPNAQNRQVQIQGSQVPFVYKLLTDQYKIPVKFIRGHETFIKKQKK